MLSSTKLQSRREAHFTTRLARLSKFRLLNFGKGRPYIERGSRVPRGPPPGLPDRGENLSFDEELHRIDLDITKLKIQFDLYFIGSVPKPPTDQRDALDKVIKKAQFNVKSSADRFLYNAVLNKFNAYSELWMKNLRIREEGVHLHPMARRAARQAAASAAASGGSNGSGAGARAAAEAAPGRGAAKPPEQTPDSWRISASRRDEPTLRNLYDRFIAAKDQVGDQKKPSFDAFAREIARHAAAIKDQVDCDLIDFKIYSKDNKVSIKAKPLK